MSKYNNYDNWVKNVSLNVYKNNDMQKLYPKPLDAEKNVTRGVSLVGSGDRAVLYGARKTKSRQKSTTIEPRQLNLSNTP